MNSRQLLRAHDETLDAAATDRRVKNAFRLLYVLRRRHNYKTDTAPFHRVETLAKILGCDVKTVRRMIRQLVSFGYLNLEPRNSTSNPHSYRIAILDKNSAGTKMSLDPKPRDKNVPKQGQKCPKTPYNNNRDLKLSTIEAEKPLPTIQNFTEQEQSELQNSFSEFRMLFGVESKYRFIGRRNGIATLVASNEFDRIFGQDNYARRLERILGPVEFVGMDDLEQGC